MRPLRAILPILLILGCAACAAAGDFQVGNLNPPMPPAAAGVLEGGQTFAYLFFPWEQASCPGGGFQLESVSILLEFGPDQVPATFLVGGGLLAAQPDPLGGWLPGPVLCDAPPIPFIVQTPGPVMITVPVPPECGCLPLDQPYFLFLDFIDPVAASLAIDGLPEAGVVFLDDGTGWVDMVGIVPDPDKTAGGKVIIWGDILCCEPPIGAESSAWGAVKTLYR